MDLHVNEMFGPTYQGEGRSVGRRCVFLRLAKCNLNCVWCDTPYTWAYSQRKAALHREGKVYDIKQESQKMPPEEVVAALRDLDRSNPNLVVISGGEPMMQQAGIAEVVGAMSSTLFEIETAGTIAPINELLREYSSFGPTLSQVRYNVSPKLASSGNSLKERRVWESLFAFEKYYDAIFKFVVTKDTWIEDVAEITAIQTHLNLHSSRIYIMPEGTTRQGQIESMEFFADSVLDIGWNLTPRLHTLIWGDERAR